MNFVKTVGLASLCVLGLLANKVQANDAIKQKLNMIGLEISKINDSKVPGLKEVVTNRGIFYVSENGQYLVAGRMFDIDAGMENLTDKSLNALRKKGVAEFKDSMITFPAENEKHKVTVFTDTTCGYCKKLHGQIDDYNKLGITVQYLAFPRGGMRSRSFDALQSVWCAKDKKQAMTAAKSGDSVDAEACATKIAEHYELGQASGITGTPAIILDDGSMIGGYKPPQALIRDLNNK